MPSGSRPEFIRVQRPVSPRVMRKMGSGAWAAKLVLPQPSVAYRISRMGCLFAGWVTNCWKVRFWPLALGAGAVAIMVDAPFCGLLAALLR